MAVRELRGCVAVVTGAGSGIGRSLAHQLADAGAKLAISDINEVGLAETAAECERRGATVHSKKLDVADRTAFFAYADEVAQHFGAVNLVVNNAGVALDGYLSDMSLDDFEWLFSINFWGVLYGTKAFLPHLERSEWGHVVNVSSVFGIIGVPGQSAYNAAKFAVRGLTESLRQELEMAGSSVSASSVHPGGIRTNIVKNARLVNGKSARGQSPDEMAREFAQIARTSPDEAARVILDGVRKNRRRILIGIDARAIDLMQRLLPTGYQAIVTKVANRRLAPVSAPVPGGSVGG